jgi:hypothetical protein
VIGVTRFDTAIGGCGVAWSDIGLVAVQLPEGDDAATMARLGRRLGGGPSVVSRRPRCATRSTR